MTPAELLPHEAK